MGKFMEDFYNLSASTATGTVRIDITGMLRAPDAAISELGWRQAAVLGAVISACDMSQRVCYAAEETIGKWVGRSREYVGIYLKQLLDAEYIKEIKMDRFPTKVYTVTDKVSIRQIISYDDVPTKHTTLCDSFIPVFRYMVENTSLSSAMIYGMIYRMSTYHKVESERSLAKISLITDLLGMTYKTVHTALRGDLVPYVESIPSEEPFGADRYVATGI